jgi:excisionase family DNA binding protein
MSRMLSPEQVARRAGFKRRAIYRCIERGELRASRLCGRLRIKEEDMEAWIAANVVVPAPVEVPDSNPASPSKGLRRLLDDEWAA